jgi:predicted TIM-barrel fold metal-dependent hydrolase
MKTSSPPGSAIGYRLFDADNHYYEPRDCFTRYIEPEHRDKAIRVERDREGRERIVVGEKPFTFLGNYDFDRSAKPGALREMLRMMSTPDYEGQVVEENREEFINRDARLATMAEQGIESMLLFPTLAVCVEQFMTDDVDQMYANIHAFNRWLDEEWGFDYQGRIYAPPLLSLLDLDRAVAELEFVLAKGAKVIALRPGPAYGRSPADPHFDPFWERVSEAGVTVAFHIGESGYNEMMSVWFGEEARPSSHRQSAFQWSCFYGDRPIMDTIAALIFHNLFGRYPNLKVVSVENGSLFVPYLMKLMDKMGGMGRNGPWIGGRIREKPSRIMKRHVFVSPYHEEDIPALAATIGASQVVFGSDYPHPEGLAEPVDFLESIESMSATEIRMIMRDNALGLVGRAAESRA